MVEIRPHDPVVLLIAEDDPEDQMLIRKAMERNRLANTLRFVDDGMALLRYLRHEPPFEDPGSNPDPGLILLDLNMPGMDGREALEEIKSDPELAHIPVIVLTTSKEEEDIARSYMAGANSFITKPVKMDELVEVMRMLGEYWLQIVRLPGRGRT